MRFSDDRSVSVRYFRLPLLVLLALVIAGCLTPAAPQQARSTVVEAMARGEELPYARPDGPIDFVFPRDHGPHEEYRTEWWYYTGNLADVDDNEYGYQLTFFRTGLTPDEMERDSDLATNQVYMAHFAVTDVSANEHRSFDRYSRGAGGLAGAIGEPNFEVWLEDWQVEEIEPGVQWLRAETTSGDSAEADDPEIALELELRTTQAPVLHGNRGLSQKGPEAGNANYYYSLVQMATDGALTIGDETVSVDGVSWMDHEFGTSALSGDTRGWDWFSVQLDNGAILMFGEFHDGRGENRIVYEGSYVTPSGDHYTLGAGDFELDTLGDWVSPNSGITYPAGWNVRIPAHAIQLSIEPLIPDQEMDVDFVYYEGATRVDGTLDGSPVNGRGFVELTGYGSQELDEFQR